MTLLIKTSQNGKPKHRQNFDKRDHIVSKHRTNIPSFSSSSLIFAPGTAFLMSNETPLRKIIHIDMDAFYASTEQRDYPDLRGKPIVVGGSPEGRGGVVATASYEARKFGVRSVMPSKRAQQLCPQAIFVRPRFEVNKEVSRHIREIFVCFNQAN